METAIYIKTELWNQLIQYHIKEGWKVTYRYDNFDVGIDFDLVILEKNGEEILFGWDNWVEGELQCATHRMTEIEKQFDQKFNKGTPENLKPEIIAQNRKWQLERKLNSKNILHRVKMFFGLGN
ncbi:hypothetical protein GCM10011344_38530 [Dokdonia pacifica]|uniref:Uncharacterized protein n=1 Tax=Dokdonia pacifica TaxID=1627892 RepID=A0A239A0J4_9FLAO|nr:hypothetical protein [Dokdonia pacifica]GGG34085.1 hypothetical protein GCM10011344_38530 [Dokdonia pacifica]SNR88423.1 hypothetical protein SAMN06265376_10429 [Dokdonia pacifica]